MRFLELKIRSTKGLNLMIHSHIMCGAIIGGSNDLSLHEVELSGNYRCQQIEIYSYPDSPLFISTGFLSLVSSMRLN